MKKKIKILFVCIGLAGLYTCSTLINTTTQEIELNSNPPNAKISVDGKKYETTPQVINIERGTNHTVKFELEGFEPYETQITRQMSNWFWFNALNGFIPGMSIDLLTGALYSLFPDEMSAELNPAKVEEVKKKKISV
jgi:hypothetical protein